MLRSLPNPITSANANEYQHRNTTKKVETIWGDAINITNLYR